MENQSGLQPLGRAVLVKMAEASKKKDSVIHIPEAVQERNSVMEQQAVVVAVGASCWEDEALTLFGFPVWRRPRAKAGDKVIVTKLAGYVTRGPADGKLYRLVNDRDLFCKVTREAADENL